MDGGGSPNLLALDAAGNPHISYYRAFCKAWADQGLKHAYWTGSAWIRQIVGNDHGLDRGVSLALDTSGNPQMSSYGHWGAGGLWYGVGRHPALVDGGVGGSGYPSLVLDTSDNPHISYGARGSLKYARWTGSAWITQIVDSGGDVGYSSSLALDAAGNPHISYYDTTHGNLKYAYWTGNAWITQTVDSEGDVGQDPSLVLDSSGNPHISYYDATNHYLKYAHWTDAAPTPTASPTPRPSATSILAPTPTLIPGGVLYPAREDTYLNQWQPTTNYAASAHLVVRQGGVMGALLRFDLSALSTAARVNQARLNLYVDYRSNASVLGAEVYRVKRPWVVGEATWERASSAQDWEAPGCNGSSDRDAAPVSDVDLDAYNAWVSFDVSELVCGWVADPASNQGLLIKGAGGTSVQYGLASAQFEKVAFRPQLVVYASDVSPTPTSSATTAPTATFTPTATPTLTRTATPTATVTPAILHLPLVLRPLP